MNKIISDLLKEAKIEKTLVLAHEFDEDRELSEDVMKRIEDAMEDVDVHSFVEDESFPYEYGSERGTKQYPKKIVFENSDQLLLDFKSNLPTKEVTKILNEIDWKKKILSVDGGGKTSPDPVELKLKFTPKEKKILVEWTDAS